MFQASIAGFCTVCGSLRVRYLTVALLNALMDEPGDSYV
jgi:hypothetical protein